MPPMTDQIGVLSLEVPLDLLECRLMRAGGFFVLRELLPAAFLEMLRADALTLAEAASRTMSAVSLDCEGRGGTPARAFRSANASPIQYAIVGSREVVSALSTRVGVPIEPTGGGTYTYYDEPGDFLALHRDIETCDITLISCLSNGPARDGGRLRLYPELVGRSLAARDESRVGAIEVDLAAGESLFLLGGILPHEVTALGERQRRIVSLMCYRPLP